MVNFFLTLTVNLCFKKNLIDLKSIDCNRFFYKYAWSMVLNHYCLFLIKEQKNTRKSFSIEDFCPQIHVIYIDFFIYMKTLYRLNSFLTELFYRNLFYIRLNTGTCDQTEKLSFTIPTIATILTKSTAE